MRESQPKAPSPGPVSRDVGSADPEQPSREASVSVSGQSSGQGSVRELELNSAMAEFAMKFFRCDIRIIRKLFVVL